MFAITLTVVIIWNYLVCFISLLFVVSLLSLKGKLPSAATLSALFPVASHGAWRTIPSKELALGWAFLYSSGNPSQGWSGRPGARACREHPAAAFRRLTQSRAPRAGFRGAGVFVPSAFVFQDRQKRPPQSGLQPAAVAAPVSRSTVCEEMHLHKNRNLICRIKSVWGVQRALQSPTAVGPSRDREAAEWRAGAPSRSRTPPPPGAGGNRSLGNGLWT